MGRTLGSSLSLSLLSRAGVALVLALPPTSISSSFFFGATSGEVGGVSTRPEVLAT